MKKTLLQGIAILFCLLLAKDSANAQSIATIISTSPATNSQSGSLTNNVIVTFDDIVSAPSASNTAMRVFGNKRGSYSFNGGGTYTGNGTTSITYNPNRTFLPGELISIINNASTNSGAGFRPATSYFWGAAAPATAQLTNALASTTTVLGTVSTKQIESADLNNDGNVDIVFSYNNAANGTSLAYMLNNGLGSFAAPVVIYTGAQEQFVEDVFTIGDLNNDGDVDIALVYETVPDLADYYIRIFSNNGSASFSTTNTFLDNNGAMQIKAVDVDSDGDLDLVILNSSTGALYHKPNNGIAGFAAAAVPIYNVANILSFEAGDFNGDRRMDFVTSRSTSGFLRVSLQNVNGTFATSAYATGASNVNDKIKILDIDNDGDLDVAFKNISDRSITFMTNNGSGALATSSYIVLSSGDDLRDYELADMDGDGDFDLIIASSQTATRIYKNNAGAFALWHTNNSLANTQTFTLITASDFDNDGDIDIVGKSNGTVGGAQPIRFFRNDNLVINPGAVASSICTESSFNVNYTANVTFNGSNVFYVQLSDSSGSFASPEVIGYLTSTASNGVISCVIPSYISSGSGYRIRVSSSNPMFNGSQSTAFSIVTTPTIALSSRVCNSSASTAIVVSGATTYSWLPATGLNTVNGASVIATPSAPTTYTVTGISNGCVSSASISVSNTCYCTGSYAYACTSEDYINDVELDNIDNTSTGCNGNLGNYIAYPATGLYTTTLQAGEQYNLQFTSGPLYNNGFGVWIDYNRDNDFDDANEFVYSVSPTNSSGASIYVPSTLVEGASVMRIRSIYGLTPTSTDACNNQSYGEIEDYKVMLVNPFTVISTIPTSNQNNVALSSNSTVTFSSNIGTLGIGRMHSSLKGLRTGSSALSQPSILFNPTLDFKPGERVTVSFSNYQGANGATMARPYQFEFFAAAGTGTARFQTLTSIASGNISDIVAGDFNNDGDIDYAVTRATQDEFAITLQTYNNNGSGTFSSGNTFTTFNDVAIAAGDLDNDGDLDLVTAVPYGSNNMDFYTNNGSGVFTSSLTTWTTEAATNIELADMDGDGNLDIVCSNPTTGRLFYYRNNGTGALNTRFSQYQTDIQVLANINSFTIGDFNNDGLLDVASGRTSSGFIRINYNNPNSPGYFQNAVAVFSGSTNTESGSLKSVDFDGDGDLDIITTKPTDGTIIIVKNNYPSTGAASYSLAQTITVNASPKLIEVADFDGDGDMDIYAAHTAAAAVYISNNSGTFAVTTNATGGSPAIICAADFDGDGDIDIVGKTTAGAFATPITFIQNAAYTVTASVLSSSVCAGGYIGVGRALSPTTWPLTTFTAELSNASGSFSTPVALGSVSATTGYSGGFAIPSNTPAGAGYRIRWSNTLTGSTVVQSGTFVVTVLTPFNVTGGGQICQGSNATISLSGSTSGIRYRLLRNGNPIDSLNGTGNPLNFTSSIVGTYTIEAVNTSSYCTATMNGSVTITVNPRPNSYGVSGGGNYCAVDNGVSIYLSTSNTGITYELLLGGNPTGITLVGTGSNLEFQNITTAGTYTIRATNNTTGCQRVMNNSVTVSITPSVPVSVTISPSINPICAGQSVTFTAVATNSTSPTYVWKVNGVTDANASSTSNTFTTTTINNGDVVTLELYVGTYCASPSPAVSNAVTITVNPNVTPTISITGPNSICSGQSATYTANNTNGGATPNYRWRVGGTIVQNGTSNTYSTSALTNGQIVRCELTSNANCASPTVVNSNNITVTVTPSVTPSVTISASSTTACAGTSILFSSNVTNGGANPFYQWRINGVAVSGANNATFSTTTLTNGQQVSLQITSNAVCASPANASSTPITVTINPTVSPSITISPANNPLCNNDGAFTTFTANIANAGVNPTINWYVNSTFQSGGANQTTFSSYLYSNGDVVTATLISSAACASPSSIGSNAFTITVNTATDPVITESPIGTLNSTAAVDYQWYLNGSPIASAINQSYNYLSVGNYTVEITDTLGCSALSATYSVGVPTITVSPISGPFCPGNTFNVAYTVSSVFFAGNVFTAQLSNAAGSFASAVNIGSLTAINSGTISATLPGGTPFGTGYKIRVVASSPTASSTPTNAFTINAITSAGVSITASPAGTQCAGTAITYTATPVNGGAIPQYQWLVNSSPVGSNSPNFTSSTLNNGDVVNVVLTSNLACVTGSPVTSSGITQQITPLVTPSVSISGSSNFCEGATANYLSSINNGGANPQYQWKINGSAVAGATASSYSDTTLNNGDVVSLQLTSNAACVSSSVVQSNNLTITVNPNPAVLNVLGGGYVCAGGNVAISLNASQVGVNYTLIQLPTSPISTISGTGNPISFNVSNAGTYSIEANSVAGCFAVMNGTVTVTLSPAPTQFALTGTSPICSNSQTPISLSGSQSGFSYQLFANSNPVSSSIVGNGSPINFGMFQNAATYSVKITNNTTLCVGYNTAQFVLVQNPVSAVFNLSGPNSICENLDVVYTLSGSTVGFKYILKRDNVFVDTLLGTGSALSFAPVNTAGTYTCIAVNNSTSCTNLMNGSISLITLPVPLSSSLYGPYNLCPSSSAIVTLSYSEFGVSYELFNDFGTTGIVKNGTGDTLQYSISEPSYYYVMGTNSDGCQSQVADLSILSASTAQQFDVIGGGTICAGDSGVYISLSNSEYYYSYNVLLDGVTVTSGVYGTDLPMSFGPYTAAGNYTITATDYTCETEMNGSAQIIVLPSLPAANAGSDQNICANNSVLSANNAGAGNTGTWSILSGTGTFSSANDPNATISNIAIGANSYLWTISNGTCLPKVDTVTIYRSNLPTVFASTGGGAFCQGLPGVAVGLNGSQGAIEYTLAVNGIPLNSLYGSGAALNFGLQTTPGNYTITATDTVTGCPSTMSGVIVVTETPTPAAPALSIVNNCGSSEITATGVNGTLTWSASVSGNPITVLSGSYSVQQTVSGCISASSNVITANPIVIPAAPILSVADNCQFSSVTASGLVGTLSWVDGGTGNPRVNLPSGTYGAYQTQNGCISDTTYIVTNPVAAPSVPVLSVVDNCGNATLTISGLTNPFTWTDGGTGNPRTVSTAGSYGVYQTASGCNSDTAYITANPIVIPAAPVLSIVNNCGSSEITATGVTGALAWNDLGSGNPRTVSSGSYTVTQTQNGCESPLSNQVTANPLSAPITSAIIGNDTPNCNATAQTYSVSLTSGSSYAWIVPFGASIVSGATGPNNNSIVVNFATSNGSVSVVETNNNGCSGVAQALPINLQGCGVVIDFTASTDSLCAGLTTIFTNTTSGILGATDFAWDFGTGASPATAIGNGPHTVTYTGAGLATVTLTLSGDVNGALTKTDYITVHPAITSLVFNAFNETCSNSNGTALITNVTGGTAPYLYDFNGGGYSNTTSYSALVAGSYPIVVLDNNGCSYSNTITINNISGPTGFSTAITAASCGASDGSIQVNSVIGGTAPYTYSEGGGNYFASNLINNLSAATWNIFVEDANGCTFNQLVTVGNVGGLSVSLTTTDETCGFGNGSISSSISGGTLPFTYQWSNGDTSATINFLNEGAYTLSVSDAFGCIGTASDSIFDKYLVLSAVLTNETCGNANGAIDITVVNGESPYFYGWSNGESSEDIAGLSANTYSVFVSDNNGCSTNDTYTISNSGSLSASIVTGNANCGQTDGQIEIDSVSGGLAPYQYSLDSINFVTNNIFAGLSAGNYTVYVKDAASCGYSQAVTLINTSGISAISTSITNETCTAANGTFDVTSITGGSSPYSYSIDGVNSYSTSLFTGLSEDNYTIFIKDANNCIFSQNFDIYNRPAVDSVLTQITDATCGTSNGSIEVNVVNGGTAPFFYSIDGVSYSPTNLFTNLLAGSYTLFVSDSNSCVYSKSITINNSSAVTAITSTQTNSTCGAANGSFEILTITGGAAPYLFSTDGTNYNTDSSFTFLLAGNYTLYVQDDNSCLFTQNISINNTNGVSAITTTIVDETCNASNGSIEITAVAGGFAPYTYSIDGISYGANTVFTALAPATYTVYVQDSNLCIYSEVLVVGTITPSAAPVITTTDPLAVCDGNTITLTSSYATGNVWSTGETTTSITISAVGTSTIDISHTDANGCSSTSAPIIVTVNALPAAPVITASGALTFCDGGSVDLTSSYSFGNTWSTSDTTSTITVSAVGVNTLVVTHTDVNGCSSSSAPTIVTVNALPASPVITASGTTTFCDGGSVDLTSSYGFGNVWSTTETTNTITVAALGVNTITLTHTDVNGCSSTSAPTVVTVNALPAAPLIAASGALTFCDGDSVDLTSSFGFGNAWSTGETTSTITVSAVGVNTITLTHTDVNGCSSTSAPTIVTVNTLPATPVITASGTTTFCDGGSVDLTSSYGFGNMWSTTETSNTITVSALGVNTITLSHTDVNGCSSTSAPTIVTVNALPAAPVISASGALTFCDGGSVDLTSSYGFGNVWSTTETTTTITVSALGVNTIDVTHTDINGCVSTSIPTIVTVNALPAQPVVSAFGPLVFCSGGSVQLASNEPSGNTWNTLATSQSINVTSTGNYSVTYTDANGCSQTSSDVQVVVNTPLPATLNLSNTIACEGSASVVLDGGLPIGGSYIGSGVINNILYPALLPEGVYAIDYIVNDINGCASTASQNFVIDAAPLVNITASQSIVCVNYSTMVILTGSPAGGTYSGSGVTGNMFDPTIAGPGIHTITYNYTAVNGCLGQSTTTIVVNALPQLTLLTQSNVCQNGAIVTLNNGFPTGGTYEIDGIAAVEIDPSILTVGNHTLTYVYNPVNGCSNSISTVFAINASPVVSLASFASICSSASALVLNSGIPSGGSYIGSGVLGGVFYPNLANPNNTITYSYTDANGCTASASQNIVVIAPQAISIAALAPICISEPAFALNNASPAGGTYTGQGVVANTFDAALAGSGLHVITYEVVDINGCLAQATQTIIVNDLPQITALQPAPICGNSNPINLNFAQPSGGVYSGIGVSAGTFDPSVSGAGTFAITYSYTNNNGCTNTTVQNITVNDAPLVTQSAYADVCSNSGLIQLSNGSPVGGNYSGNFVNNGTFNSTLSGAGVFDITYQYVDTNGCSAQAISSITVNALPVLSLTSLGNVCSGSGAITLSNGLPAGGTYYGLGINAGVLDPTLVPAGAQQLGYTFTDANGCTDSTAITYSIYNLQANAGSDQSITCTTSANLQGQSNYSGLSPLTYSWSPTIGLSNPNSQNTSAMPSVSTNYVLTVSDGVCSSTDTVLVIVAPSNFNLSATASNQVFNNPPFIVFFTNNTPSPSNYSFEWNFGDSTSYIGFQPVYHNYTNNGVYSVTLIATALGSGCVDTLVMSNLITCNNAVICNDSANIIVDGVLIPNNSNFTTSICANSNFVLNTNTNPNYSYQWYYNGIPLQGGLNSSFAPNVTGYYTVGIENNNCINLSSPVYINVLPTPAVPFITSTGSNNFCAGGALTLQANSGYTSYLWSTGETQSSISVNTSGIYWVQGSDANGCSAKSLDFAVNGSIMLPQYICVATVDTVANKNRIIWEKPVTTSIDSFLVYRETVLAGVYQQIGSVDYNDNSEFVDLTSNPDVSSSRYRLAIKDSCGNNTTQGDIHGTIKTWLTPLGNGTDSVEVFFTKYVGIDSLTYTLYRGPSINNLTPVGNAYSFSGTGNIYAIKDLSIPAYPNGYAYYQVRANLVNLCNSDSTAYLQSISNTVSIGNTIGINEHNSIFTVNAFPNPNNGSFQIALESNTVEDVSLIIYNQIGAVVWKNELERTIGKTIVNVPLEFAAQGVYQLQVIASKKTINKRIIISK